jgi:hypothetical protein
MNITNTTMVVSTQEAVGRLVRYLMALQAEEIGQLFEDLSSGDLSFWDECTEQELLGIKPLLDEMVSLDAIKRKGGSV